MRQPLLHWGPPIRRKVPLDVCTAATIVIVLFCSTPLLMVLTHTAATKCTQ